MNIQFKKGVLELVVLCLVCQKDCYGFELVTEISKDINISEGTIYPLLKRLKDDHRLETYLQESPGGPPRKYYRCTRSGEEYKDNLVNEWKSFVGSVNRIIEGGEDT